MSGTPGTRLWDLVGEQADGHPITIDHVCAAVMSAAGVDTAAVAILLPTAVLQTVHAADRRAEALHELMLTLREGPCFDASDGPVLAADLTTGESTARWPRFAPAAVTAGVQAVFALPLWVGAIRLGVLGLYRAAPGGLDRQQLADALELAGLACTVLLYAADGHQKPGRQRLPLDPYWLEQAAGEHAEVHQATGMLTVQLGVGAPVALVRLRAYAYVHGRALRDVAADVVAHRLRFGPSQRD